MPALLEVVIDPASWESVAVTIQGQQVPVRLQHLGGSARVVATWDRAPAGRYRLELHSLGNVEARTVEIRPSKITQDELDSVILELETTLAPTVAMAMQRTGALSGIELRPPEAMTVSGELERLRRTLYGTATRAGLIDTTRSIATNPHRMLAKRELWTQAHRARRPGPTALARALAKPGNLGDDRRPTTVLDTRVEHTVDVYENRLLKTLLRQVSNRARRIALISGTAGSEASEMLGELRKLDMQAHFLRDVGNENTTLRQISMVLARRPDYRAMLETMLEFRKGATVVVRDAALDAPLENVPYLYELWGTLQVATAALDVAADLGYRTRKQDWIKLEAQGLFIQRIGANVAMTHPTSGIKVRVRPQRRYTTNGGALRSISFSQIPDIAIEIQRPSEPTDVYIFDPKYKLESVQSSDEELNEEAFDGGPKKVDIDKMHAYRDSIRRADGKHAVRYAAILYPGPTHTFSDGLEAIACRPADTGQLQTKLRQLLTQWLEPQTPMYPVQLA